MRDSAISAMPLASLPLSEEPVPCVQDGRDVQAPAAAFGIPFADVAAPMPLAQFQTWIDRSTSPPTLRMYLGSNWVALYTIAEDGALALAEPLTLPGDPISAGEAATKAYVDGRPCENLLANSAFDVWQESSDYTLSSSAAKTHVADCWKAGTSAAGRTVSRVAGISASRHALKIQRTAGEASTDKVVIAQQFGQAESMGLAGKSVVVSFDYLVGDDYSSATGPLVVLYHGTGTDEDIDLHASSPSFATAGDSVGATLLSQVAGAGTVARLVTPPMAIPDGITELAFAILVGGFAGTAGADDSATIANVKMEIGTARTPYRGTPLAEEVPRCQRRYRKSFAQAVAPSQNAGASTGEQRWRRFAAGAMDEGLQVRFGTPMRTAPAIAFFNPSAANGQVRNETSGADCSAAASQNVTDAGFEVACTGDGAGAAGDWLGVHWVADARL